MDWSGVDYCDVFISCLDSHSDGTHSLQRIYCWASDGMLHFSKSDEETIYTWGWGHFQQILISGRTILYPVSFNTIKRCKVVKKIKIQQYNANIHTLFERDQMHVILTITIDYCYHGKVLQGLSVYLSSAAPLVSFVTLLTCNCTELHI